MLGSLRVAPLLDGWRGSPPLAREEVVDLLLKLAELAATGEVHELDINPVAVLPGRVVGLDALVRLGAGS
jgi:succinyl-CoA synthetase beta subunit